MNVVSKEKLVVISDMLFAGNSIREIRAATGVSKNTVRRYKDVLGVRNIDIRCACGKQAGHRGWCSHRLAKSPARMAFLSRWTNSIIVPAHLKPPRSVITTSDRLLAYPYFTPRGRRLDGEELLASVWSTVSRLVSPERRADVCQDAMLEILEGRLNVNAIEQGLRHLLRKSARIINDKNVVSADLPRFENGGESIIDGISYEQYREAFT
jgi:hypothetical protein